MKIIFQIFAGVILFFNFINFSAADFYSPTAEKLYESMSDLRESFGGYAADCTRFFDHNSAMLRFDLNFLFWWDAFIDSFRNPCLRDDVDALENFLEENVVLFFYNSRAACDASEKISRKSAHREIRQFRAAINCLRNYGAKKVEEISNDTVCATLGEVKFKKSDFADAQSYTAKNCKKSNWREFFGEILGSVDRIFKKFEEIEKIFKKIAAADKAASFGDWFAGNETEQNQLAANAKENAKKWAEQNLGKALGGFYKKNKNFISASEAQKLKSGNKKHSAVVQEIFDLFKTKKGNEFLTRDEFLKIVAGDPNLNLENKFAREMEVKNLEKFLNEFYETEKIGKTKPKNLQIYQDLQKDELLRGFVSDFFAATKLLREKFDILQIALFVDDSFADILDRSKNKIKTATKDLKTKNELLQKIIEETCR